MACFSPLTGYRTPAGKVTFKMTDGYHDKPVTIACGQCSGCRLERSRQWAVRCLLENQMHETSCFLTLTYSDAKLPLDGGLDVAHWQRFAKRLRKARGPFRYYHCGEYGEQTFRPHYHALLFGLDFQSDQVQFATSNDLPLFKSPSLDELWGHGFCQIGEVTFESAAYVARYIMKKQTGKQGLDLYGEATDFLTGEVHSPIKPPYTTMSRRPGIGSTWFSKYSSDVFPRDEVIVNGKKTRPPKYFDDLVDQVDLEEIKILRRKLGRKHRANNTPERLKVRETILERKMKRLPRHNKF